MSKLKYRIGQLERHSASNKPASIIWVDEWLTGERASKQTHQHCQGTDTDERDMFCVSWEK